MDSLFSGSKSPAQAAEKVLQQRQVKSKNSTGYRLPSNQWQSLDPPPHAGHAESCKVQKC